MKQLGALFVRYRSILRMWLLRAKICTVKRRRHIGNIRISVATVKEMADMRAMHNIGPNESSASPRSRFPSGIGRHPTPGVRLPVYSFAATHGVVTAL